jgi:thiamine pyrophosphate-dependent acetolactate synthase large subunit-like protein
MSNASGFSGAEFEASPQRSKSYFVRAVCGTADFRCETPDQIKPAIQAAFNTPGPVIVKAIVDKIEPTLQPMKVVG